MKTRKTIAELADQKAKDLQTISQYSHILLTAHRISNDINGNGRYQVAAFNGQARPVKGLDEAPALQHELLSVQIGRLLGAKFIREHYAGRLETSEKAFILSTYDLQNNGYWITRKLAELGLNLQISIAQY